MGTERPTQTDCTYDSFREAFYDFTWEASLWNGDTYAYPISVESLGLIYNKALVETPPRALPN